MKKRSFKNYENRVVLFLDILGFQDHINRTVNTDDKDEEKEIFKLSHTLLLMKALGDGQNSRVSTQFSDSLVISFKEDDKNQVLELLDTIASLILPVIKHGILFRGAISYGKLIHTDEVVFGPALVDAYLTESKAAIYPRVVLDKNIIDLGITKNRFYNDKESAEKGLLSYLNKDEDEKYYIDYFEQSHYRFNLTELIEYVEALRKIIIAGNRFQKADLKIKYGWMKSKFNKMIDKYTSEKFLSYYKSYPVDKVKRLCSLKRI